MNIGILTTNYLPDQGGIQFLLYWLLKSIDKKFRYKQINKFIFIVPHCEQKSFLEFKNIEVVEYDIPHGKKESISFIFTLSRISKQYSLDLLHCHSAVSEGFWCLGTKFLTGIPYIVTCHGSDVAVDKRFNYGSRLKLLSSFFIKLVLNNASLVTTLCTDMVTFVEDAGAHTNKIKIIPEAIETNEPLSDPESQQYEKYLRKKYCINDSHIVYLTLSGMREIKGHVPLLKAFSEALKKNQNLLLFIGANNPEMEKKLKSLIKVLKIEGLVHFIGNVLGAKKKAWFNLADIYCNTAFFEPFGIVYLESILYKTAVIGSIYGGANDIFEHKKSAYLVNPENINEISEGILALSEDRFREEIIRNSQTLLSKYDINKISDEYLNIYLELAKKRK